MTFMIIELYDALISAGADEPKARAAAEAIANYHDDIKDIKSDTKIIKSELHTLKWIMGVIFAMLIPMLWQIFSIYKSLPK